MQRIDVHNHLWSQPNGIDRIAEECEKAGIARICLSGTGRQHHQEGNEQVLEAWRKYPDLVVPFAWVHLDRESASDIRQYAEQGFRGLKVIDPLLPYDHWNYLPIYEAAARLDLPVLFHCGIKTRVQGGPRSINDNHRPIRLDNISRRYPELRLILAHIGTPWHDEAFMVARVNPNVFLELTSGSGWSVKGMNGTFFRDKLWWEGAWNKILFGTDVLPERFVWAVNVYESLMEEAGLADTTKKAVYHLNARNLWKAPPFP